MHGTSEYDPEESKDYFIPAWLLHDDWFGSRYKLYVAFNLRSCVLYENLNLTKHVDEKTNSNLKNTDLGNAVKTKHKRKIKNNNSKLKRGTGGNAHHLITSRKKPKIKGTRKGGSKISAEIQQMADEMKTKKSPNINAKEQEVPKATKQKNVKQKKPKVPMLNLNTCTKEKPNTTTKKLAIQTISHEQSNAKTTPNNCIPNKQPKDEIFIQQLSSSKSMMVFNEKSNAKEKIQQTISHEQSNAKTTPCLLYTSPSPRDLSTSRMPSSA